MNETRKKSERFIGKNRHKQVPTHNQILKMNSFTAILLVGFVCAFAGKVSARVEIDCSVFVYGQNAWLYNVSDTSECIASVSRVRQYCGGSKINFYPTAHFYQTNSVATGFCYWVDTECVPVNDSMIQTMAIGMFKCFDAAVKEGFTHIEVSPHLDDGAQSGFWRNALVMNPLAVYANYSYYDVMVKPIAQALNQAAMTTTQAYMSMQGEMNLMVMTYPYEFLQMARASKCVIAGSTLPVDNVKVGVSLNYNKLFGMDYANTDYAATVDLQAIHNLFYGVDFLGMSSYPNTDAVPLPAQFSNAISPLASELSFVGINLGDLLAAPGHELHFSEAGVGGGICNEGNCPAKTFAEAVQTPYFGIFGEFNPATNPWGTPEMQSALTTYYKQFVIWATEEMTYQYPVSAVFLWTVSSWDVCSIYHSDSNTLGTYRIDAICTMLQNWNDKGIVPV